MSEKEQFALEQFKQYMALFEVAVADLDARVRALEERSGLDPHALSKRSPYPASLVLQLAALVKTLQEILR